MKRLDLYAEHLFKHRALQVHLASDAPVIFRFPQGDKASTKSLNHDQLETMVHEVIDVSAAQALRQSGSCSFERTLDAGQVRYQVRAVDGGSLSVTMSPAPRAGRTPAETTVRVDSAAPPEPDGPSGGPSGVAVSSAVAAPPPRSGMRRDVPPPSVPRRAVHEFSEEDADDEEGFEPASGESAGREDTFSGYELDASADEPAINSYLRRMVRVGASDLHVSSMVVPMLRLHGSMEPIEREAPLSPDALKALIWPIMPERNRAEYEAKSDTDFAHTIEGVARFRANVFRDRHGIGGVFRQIPFEILAPEKLGLPKTILDLCWLSKGLVLVTGPTGSGKSTTLASLIDVINRERADHIITIEDPIEFVHQNKRCLVNQREISVHTDSFKAALRAALREDPDIVLVGEMRDLETVAIAIETAETGHLVFGTLHTNTAPSTVDRIIDQFPSGQQAQIRTMLAESLQAVVAQVLCKKVGGGRIAAYEILIANNAVRNLIREGKTFQLKSTMQTGKGQGMQTLNDHLLKHVVDGVVEPIEAYVKSTDKQHFREMLAQRGFDLDLTKTSD